MSTIKITVNVSANIYQLLEVLTKGQYAPASVEGVILALIDHAQQGIYRPGSWERPWLAQAFGDDWTAHLEPGDPYGRDGGEAIFERPRREPPT